MPHSPLLLPLVALVGWTLVMLVWMAAVRLPAMKRIKRPLKPGGRGQDLDGVIPPSASWPAHNYMHLMEQPTLFYAIVLALVAMGDTHDVNLWLAWAYVVLRVLHSLVQATVNIVFPYRFGLFMLSSICLFGLTIHAGAALLR